MSRAEPHGRHRPNPEGNASWWSRKSRCRLACSSPERSSSRSSKAREDRQGRRPIASSWRRSTSINCSYSPEAADAFYQRLLDGASRLPDAEAAGLARRTSVWTFGRGKGPGSIVVWAPDRKAEVVIGGYAGGDLFGALGLRLLAGRTFTAADRTGPPRVAVVNLSYAEGLPERRAIGRTLRVTDYVQSRRQTDAGRTGRVTRSHDRRRHRIGRRAAVHAEMAARSGSSTSLQHWDPSLPSRSTRGPAGRRKPWRRRFASW